LHPPRPGKIWLQEMDECPTRSESEQSMNVAKEGLGFGLLADPREKVSRVLEQVRGVGMFALHKDGGGRASIGVELLEEKRPALEECLKKGALGGRNQAGGARARRQRQGVGQVRLLGHAGGWAGSATTGVPRSARRVVAAEGGDQPRARARARACPPTASSRARQASAKRHPTPIQTPRTPQTSQQAHHRTTPTPTTQRTP
jgi:hypothetical protein